MSTDRHLAWQRETFSLLRGRVLDVGAGDGAPAQYLPAHVDWLALEPRPSRRLNRRVDSRPRSTVLRATAEQLPLPDRSVDAVVCSTVLCSVTDPARVLSEIRRVLRPGGRLVFFEHVGAVPGSGARRLQRMLAPLTRVCGGGCDPTRDTAAILRAAEFATLELHAYPAHSWLDQIAPTIAGTATVD